MRHQVAARSLVLLLIFASCGSAAVVRGYGAVTAETVLPHGENPVQREIAEPDRTRGRLTRRPCRITESRALPAR